MALFSRSKTLPKLLPEKTLSKDKKCYFISSLYLGDGTRSDAFMNKDTYLMDLLKKIDWNWPPLISVFRAS